MPGPPPGATPITVTVLPRDHRSTNQERLRYREAAARYQSHLVSVRRMLTQRPGLRAAAALEGEEAVVTDFAAVLDLLADDQRSVAASLRAGRGAADPRVPCVVSGLRRLPSFTGVVFSSAMLPPAAAEAYVSGAILVEPAFVYATSARHVALEGSIEYVIWSETGKRVAALAANAGRDEIGFAAGTGFKVLHADAGPASSGRIRVFLREATRAAALEAQLDEMDRRIQERLVTAAALRDDVSADSQVMAGLAGSVLRPIGLDDRGIPFRENPAS